MSGDRFGKKVVFLCLPSCLSQMGGGTQQESNEQGLDEIISWALTQVPLEAVAAHLWQLGVRNSPERPASLPRECVSVGGDSCFVPQEKLKPEFLKALPEKMKLFSQFLGKRSWFAGDKVRGRFWDGELTCFQFQGWYAFIFCLSAAHLCGFPGLRHPRPAPHI